ncbi:NXPE family member 1-like [Amphiura filiformis]|uniref:NXPE family member 1-like n=1 Tax=Amphiura filiformis TaxID=82378 RepID=UPI003B222132
MNTFRYVGYYGYNFVHRTVAEYRRNRARETGGRRLFAEHPSSRHSWSWIKKRITVLTFISLLISGIICIVSTHWQTSKVEMKISSPRNFQPIETRHDIITHAHRPLTVKSMMQLSSGGVDWRLTNASLSTYKIVTHSKDIKAAGNVTMLIQSKNGKDEELRTGGDFWLAIIYWTSTPKASCAGKIIDHNNGTYTVNFHVVRPGLAQIHVILVHPRKAVDLLKTQIWRTEKRIYWLGKYDLDGENYWSTCYVSREAEGGEDVCLYGNPEALGETVFVCRKQHGVSCDTMTHTIVNQDLTKHRTLELVGEKIYYFEKANYWNRLTNGPKILYIKSELGSKKRRKGSAVVPLLPPCNQPSQSPSSSDGYWLSEQWHSLVCHVKELKVAEIGQCLRGKHLFILGDSTLRQWVNGLHTMMGVQYVKQDNDKFNSDRYIEALDLNITFRFHPQVISGSPVDINTVEYEVDILDGLMDSDSCHFIVVLGPWAHFSQWTRESYIERLLLLKLGVERLHEKCPDVPIVVKGSHPREHDTIESIIYGSDFILHELGSYLQDIFSGSEAWFLNVWEMVLSYPKENTIHLPYQIIKQELNMFLSHVCHH